LLYGLPTQAIEHDQGVTASVRRVTATPKNNTKSGATVAFAVNVDVPNFTFEYNAQGAALVRAGNGGSTFAEPYGPIMPQIIQRFVLPLDATSITIVENQASRVSQSYGVVQLQTATPTNTQHPPEPGSFPITSTYPAQPFWYQTAIQQDGILVTLVVIPAQYQPNSELTLLKHMEFNVNYTLPTPNVSIDNVTLNNGQPVRIGQTTLPISVTVTTAQARSINLKLEVVDPSGVALASVNIVVPVLAGSSAISMNLASSSWTPGPKTMWVSIGDENKVFDSRVVAFSAAGIRVQANVADPMVRLGATVPLTITVRDENGALVGGLAGRMTFSLDGAAVSPAVSEASTGVYRADLATTGLAVGMHRVAVVVTDLRSISGQGLVEFAISTGGFRIFLPLIMRGGTSGHEIMLPLIMR
jgi:hypothetical protein